MARPASGLDVLGKAREALSKARTVGELRQAQAVILPLEFGFSMEQTASALGISKGWVCQLRQQFIRSDGTCLDRKTTRGGRRRENMSPNEEIAFLAPFFDKASKGGILVVGEIKRALDERLGRTVALASAYNLLHRHGWRKLAPDKRHPQSDVDVQEQWKKNSRNSSRKSPASGREKRRSG
jgi:transposase